ncbi:hypothetical protein ACLMJK_003989 [Lecanora helva]
MTKGTHLRGEDARLLQNLSSSPLQHKNLYKHHILNQKLNDNTNIMHLTTLLALLPFPLTTLANPAALLPPPDPISSSPTADPALTIPAVVPTSIASNVLSALPNSIAVSTPTDIPITGAGSPYLIPGLGLPPSTVFENVEACSDILSIVVAMLGPEYGGGDVGGQDSGEDPEDGGGGEDGGDGDGDGEGVGGDGDGFEVDGYLITTLIQTAAGLLSLVPPPVPNQ